MAAPTQGLLLFAHGARDPAWSAPFEAVAQRVRQARPELAVRLAFLEFMEPDVMLAGQALAEAGCTQVSIVPLFLGAGGHVRKDIPVLLSRLQAAHPQTHWHLTQAIGEVDGVISQMALSALALLPLGHDKPSA